MTLPRKRTGLSRPERRAEKRLSEKMTAFSNMIKLSKTGGKEFTAPGNSKMW